MIHILIGTKAQYIKVAPLIRQLDASGVPYNLIDSGQHAKISEALRAELKIRSPDVFMRKNKDVTRTIPAITWALKTVLLGLFCRRWVRIHIFRDEGGICVVHGDTATTLLSVILAKRAGLKVAHIEAGLRSYNYLNPFPEEIIRVITMKLADLLFVPSDWAYNNIQKMKVKGQVINLGANTIVEELSFALSQKKDFSLPFEHYCLVTIHRVETLYSARRMKCITNLLLRIARSKPVLFVTHAPTVLSLKRWRLFDSLEGNNNIMVLSLLPYTDFINLARNADFIITDGGSIQEESFYLNVPCLLMRKRTERQDGIGSNVCLSEFDKEKIEHFLTNFRLYEVNGVETHNRPSEKIIGYLSRYA